MKTKSMCFKWNKNWIIFCNKCGFLERIGPAYWKFFELLDIKFPTGQTALKILVDHMNICKGNPARGFIISTTYAHFNQIRLMKRKAENGRARNARI